MVCAPMAPNGWILILTIAAVKRLSSAKKTRMTATNTLETETQSGFVGFEDGLTSMSKNMQSISAHIFKEVCQVFEL